MIEKELEILGLKQGMKVLDAGCGTGAVSRKIALKVSPGEVPGVDIDCARIGIGILTIA